MKILYIIIGFYIGIWATSNTALAIIDRINIESDKEFLAATLTGMSKGWERGKIYTESHIYWLESACLAELVQCRKIYKEAQ